MNRRTVGLGFGVAVLVSAFSIARCSEAQGVAPANRLLTPAEVAAAWAQIKGGLAGSLSKQLGSQVSAAQLEEAVQRLDVNELVKGLGAVTLRTRGTGLEAVFGAYEDSPAPDQSVADSPEDLPDLKVLVAVPAGSALDADLGQHSEPTPLVLPGQRLLRVISVDSALAQALDRSNAEVFLARPNRPIRAAPTVPFNRDARVTHLIPAFEGTFNPDGGRSVTTAVFDEGRVRDSHQEFGALVGAPAGSRIAVHTQKPFSTHATHVAGTIAAAGIRADAIGMAPKISIWSFDWDADLQNLDAEAANIRVSNHSYGPEAGWSRDRQGRWFWWGTPGEPEDRAFGAYSAWVAGLDSVLYKHPDLLTVVAAGNDRNDDPGLQPIQHYEVGIDPLTNQAAWVVSSAVRPADGFDGGLDTLSGLAIAKNAVTIGAINDVLNANAPIQTTIFSSFGPTDDRRIKPDLVANGDILLSTSSASDKAYQNLSGTSMASPTAAGIASVVVEHFRQRRGRWPTSAETKAILIHTATDAGIPGPDPEYGWGSINAFRSGEAINSDNGEQILQQELMAGDEWSLSLINRDGQPIRVTVVWTDPPGRATNGLDETTPALQNDLDLRLVGPDGTIHHPYALETTGQSARHDRPNRVDNVEVVDAVAQAGAWRIEVDATSLKPGPRQKFAVVVSGLHPLP